MAAEVKPNFLAALASVPALHALAVGTEVAVGMEEGCAVLAGLRFELALERLCRLVATPDQMDHA